MTADEPYIAWFETLTGRDVARVGGKNASLGEMIRGLRSEGVRVPDGFAATASAYRRFVDAGGLDETIRDEIRALEDGEKELAAAGEAIRERILETPIPDDVATAVREAYGKLGSASGAGTPTWPSGAAPPPRSAAAGS